MISINEFYELLATEFSPRFVSREPSELVAYGRDFIKKYPPKPSMIVFPESTEDVARFLKLCSQHRMPVVPSGGRTGLCGGATATNQEIVLSMDRMRNIDSVDIASKTIRVQSGAVLQAVHDACALHGLIWPVDIGAKGSCQVGGNIATNAGGNNVIRYGMARNWILGVQVVTMQGDVLNLNGALEKNNTGLDLRQLFIGTEGTLGVVTEATLKLTAISEEKTVLFLALRNIEAVLALYREACAQKLRMNAFEFMDANCMNLVRAHFGYKAPFAAEHPQNVLVEIDSTNASEETKQKLNEWVESLFERNLVEDGTLAQSTQEARSLWALREGMGEAIVARGNNNANDISVPVNQLPKLFPVLHEFFSKKYPSIVPYFFGHVGDGNIHLTYFKPESMEQVDFEAHYKKMDGEIYEIIHAHQGSISAEHGVGLRRRESLHIVRTAKEIEIMKGIKKLLDPNGLLNPGKIFA